MPQITNPVQLAIRAVESAQDELVTAKKELESYRDNSADMEAELWAAKAELVSCVEAREAEAAEYRTALEAAKHDTETAKSEAKAAKVDAQEARSQRDELKEILSGGANGPIHIFDLIWGDKHYGNEAAVHDQVVDLIRTGSYFWVTNDLFRHDPLPGVNKVMTVVYRLTSAGQDGRIRTFVGLEQGQYKF
ncbi:hypothetical protein N7495_000498 [Penicillium taxi]|uniref:uncharacterized protein n=1 Tax=Penicillium taxi TaxID=168475 RepID=UPI0025451A0A|nr:uncharacterized protein N7495_000498 [Penicillium taxi]KAJ5907816.1 hypothetical protein N7495_000498 [Penicillium taxi]